MILVYTGNGKGKTSACMGQVIRGLGNGLRVGFVQFMKKDGEAGEQNFLHKLLGENFYAGGKGFFTQESQRPEHRESVLETLDWVRKHLKVCDILILDEILYALGCELITKDELKGLLDQAGTTHLILSGRGFPHEMLDSVDMVTEMTEIKHPWHSGKSAVKGIDY